MRATLCRALFTGMMGMCGLAVALVLSQIAPGGHFWWPVRCCAI